METNTKYLPTKSDLVDLKCDLMLWMFLFCNVQMVFITVLISLYFNKQA